jgi:DNA (cytosine-5)-methyltransferase 1
MNKKPTAIDLFSGCGGLTLGLKSAGYKVIGAVEIDPLAVDTYELNHPEVKVWQQDITKITGNQILRFLGLEKGELDLMAGCPPCQGFSSMRTLNGAHSVDDPRNNLLLDFLRLVKTIRPKSVMMENVPGIAEYEKFRFFIETMKTLGYLGKYNVHNAEDFGVPQRRKRLLYIAGRNQSVHFGRHRGARKTVRDAIADLPPSGKSGDFLHDIPQIHGPKVTRLIKRIPKDGGSRTDLPLREQLPCHQKPNAGFKDVYGRMAWDKVAPTITSGCFNPSKGRFLHPEFDRAITLREAAILQGFPKSYRFSEIKNKTALALMVGNALPAPLIRVHAIEIKKALAEMS